MRWVPNCIKKWIPDPDAQQLLMAFNYAAHLADDLFDRDQDIDYNLAACELLRVCLVEVPTNPFYQRYSACFVPVLMAAIAHWGASNQLYKHSDEDVRAYAWAMRLNLEALIPVFVQILHNDIAKTVQATAEITVFTRTGENRESIDQWVETMTKLHGET